MSKPKIGELAPDFNIFNEEDRPIKLSDYKGKRLIIFFYPKDNTPGCTKEACSLRDNYSKLKEMGFEILGISPDKTASHRRFISKFELPYSLGADTELKMLKDYGVWGLKKFMGREYDGVLRTTFIIDENSIIIHIIEKVRTKDHAEQIIEYIQTT